ncbi:hypothetical protein ACHAWF_007741 [Thalassiosira exigua]
MKSNSSIGNTKGGSENTADDSIESGVGERTGNSGTSDAQAGRLDDRPTEDDLKMDGEKDSEGQDGTKSESEEQGTGARYGVQNTIFRVPTKQHDGGMEHEFAHDNGQDAFARWSNDNSRMMHLLSLGEGSPNRENEGKTTGGDSLEIKVFDHCGKDMFITRERPGFQRNFTRLLLRAPLAKTTYLTTNSETGTFLHRLWRQIYDFSCCR